MTQTELTTAMEAAQERCGAIPVKHWKSVIQKYPGIESDPWIYDGRPVVRGTRIPVSVIIGYLTLGPGRDQLLRDYPDLNDAAVKEAVDFTLGLLDK